MNVRRYRAKDMSDAMRQVREHQGADAVILSSRRVEGMLEIVAALDHDGAPAEPTRVSAQSREASASRRNGARTQGHHSARGQGPVDPELDAMRRELSDLRHLLVQQNGASESAQWAARHPLAAELVAGLTECGFNEKLSRSVTGGIPEDTNVETAWSRVRARLSSALATEQPDILEHGGMLALVGPTGVGKTTTISRLALRQIRRMGRDAVSLVTLDRQRLGAYKQLQAFGQMAGVPVMLLESERELADLSVRAGDGRLVLIDTAGQAARDVAEQRLFAQVRSEVDLKTWLVIAATHQGRVLRQVLQAFQGSAPSALVLTKVDEAEQLGETLSVLLEQRLGLAFYSDGQGLGEHFHTIDTLYLTRLALRETPLRGSTFARTSSIRASAERTAGERVTARPLGSAPIADRLGPQDQGMILESVVPFRKSAHVGL
ncbi:MULTISPECIES: flagellar biosynthesis protein FlhF [Thiorhodovibrio]|uniref:flagellar biosynthesis protein FlhF n=1 Tax=Thiorhodovibrio TaxID=61593 RepID=UPI001912D76B|nr:flagellar biosynthesis protein FlhF [Thiorhodovibrio winogradskyi]MBK5971017.1 flagellar biosynthesis protein FlhF [Thiorhodovibrio winogradskyi]WPL10616.1 Flagella-associated GTP-binding protein [Thiorhodovibrio litoralis]